MIEERSSLRDYNTIGRLIVCNSVLHRARGNADKKREKEKRKGGMDLGLSSPKDEHALIFNAFALLQNKRRTLFRDLDWY
jgi:hypothetical protein